MPIYGVFIVEFWSALRASWYFVMLLMICTLYCDYIEEIKVAQSDMQKTEHTLYRFLMHTFSTSTNPPPIQNVYLLLSFCLKNMIHNVLKSIILLEKVTVSFRV